MENSSKPIVSLTNLEQAGFVVQDAEKSAEKLWDTFGIGPWAISQLIPELLENASYHGKPTSFTIRVAMTQSKIGTMQLELIEPLEGDSTYHDFLRENGEGLHHFGWVRLSSLEEFNVTTLVLENAGFPCVMNGRISRLGVMAYFDTTRVLNAMLEVVCDDPAPQLPPIDRVIPG
ncbi:VOC family protein [Chloroflexota bacterium]